MANTAASYTFKVLQGSTWDETLTIKNSDGTAMDLTGYTARMQIREDISAGDVLLELTSGNGRFIIADPTSGQIQILVDAETTADLPVNYDYQVWCYDLEIVQAGSPDYVMRILQGSVVLYPEVTR